MSGGANEASRLIGELAAGHADELDETMDSEAGEVPFAAMTVLWTNKGIRYRTSIPPHAANRRDILKLIKQLEITVRTSEAREVGRIAPR